MSAKILVVEDEDSIRIGLQDNFEMENYVVETAADGEEAVTVAERFQPDLVILDLMLPKKSGYEVCRILRNKFPEVFIIMLTAKTEEASKVAGLEMGADDYVTKPFSLLELLARVKSFLRRKDSVPKREEATVAFGDIQLDFKRFTATRAGQPVELNTREYQILKYFWSRKGEVVLREDLLQSVWGYTLENMPTTRTIDNHIVKLRQKLEDDPSNPTLILSVRGAGYKFSPAR